MTSRFHKICSRIYSYSRIGVGGFLVKSVLASSSAKIFGVTSLLLFIRHKYYKLIRKYNKYPDGLIGLPIFGALFRFAINPTKFLLYIGNKYNKICTVSIGRRTNIFINDAQLAQTVLKNHSTLNRSKLFTETRSTNSTILPLLNGKAWEQRRKYGASKLLTITSSNFISNSVEYTINKYVIPSIESCISLNKLWHPSLYVEYITFNSIFSALFGCNIDLNINDKNNFFTKWSTLINNLAIIKSKLHILDMSGFHLPKWLTNILINGTQIEQGIDELIIQWMTNNGFTIDFERGYVSRNYNKNSFCDEMIKEVNDINNSNYTLGSFIADLGSYLISGYHTTSNCAEYGFLLLAQNIHIQNQIFDELKRHGKGFDVTQLHIFRAFIFEMVRLATILPIGLPHFVQKDIVCGNGIDCIIPKGSSILINHFYIHKSNGNYWKDRVEIDKWLDNNGKFKMNSNFVMFGYGKRDCIGKVLALKQLYSMFSKLILKYKFSFDNNENNFQIKQRWQALLEVYPKVPLKIEKRTDF